jgi:predicted MFS family arabinose efflux permease
VRYNASSLAESNPESRDTTTSPLDERAIVYLMSAVQFVNVLDFMMVNPLGPMLTEALDVPASKLPIVVGSYTAAASISGLVGAFVLERFGRKRALVTCLVGLCLGTMLGGLSTGFGTLVLARILAGFFGGPATSLTSAIVADTIAPERRGWAFGIVMGGFAVASVLGVPAGLALAHLGGWRMPFFGVSIVILLAIVAAQRWLPTLDGHLRGVDAGVNAPTKGSLRTLLAKRVVLLALALNAVTVTSAFLVIPSIPSYVCFNLGLSSDRLGWLYLLGGIASLVSTRLFGPMVDRFGATRVSASASVGLALVLWVLFVRPDVFAAPVLLLTTLYFAVMGARGVAFNAITSMVAEPEERARFQSLQSAVQHAASASAAFLSTRVLSELPDHRLVHIDRLAVGSLVLALSVPLMMLLLARSLESRGRAQLAARA